MKHVLLIGIAGGIGSMLRYALGHYTARVAAGMAPEALARTLGGSLLVNVLGSLAIGFLFSAAATQWRLSPQWRDVLAIGLLGGFTTFSTFANEARVLLREGLFVVAALHILLHNGLSIAAAFAGYHIGQRFA